MAPTQTKFRAVGAVITQVIDHDSCSVVAMLHVSQVLDFSDQRRWIRVDFMRTPSRAKHWKDVWFDERGVDQGGGTLTTVVHPADLDAVGITSIGPLADLPRAQYFGGVYIRDDKFTAWRPQIDDPKYPWRPASWRVYELTSIGHSEDPNGEKRYHGIHATVKTAATAGSDKIYVDLFAAHEKAVPLVPNVEVDFSKPEQCIQTAVTPDVDETQVADTLLSKTSQVGDSGGLFLNLRYLAQMVVKSPKLPIGQG